MNGVARFLDRLRHRKEKMSNDKERNDDDLHTRELPDHLLIEHILPRLPVKSLIRFKSVSKYWHTAISSREFSERHSKFSSTKYQLLVHRDDKEEFFSLHYDEYDHVNQLVRLESSFLKKWKRLRVVGCSNGLVCLSVCNYDNFRSSFVLWNPAIRQYREIAHPHDYCDWATSSGFVHLSFDDHDDYNIVSSFLCDGNKDEDRARRLYIFSLRAAEWKRFDESEWRKRIIQYINPVICDDHTMYFVVIDRVGKRSYQVLGFNLISKKVKQLIELPDGGVFDFELLAMGDSLMIYCTRYNEILMLKQHGDIYYWEKYASFTNYPSTLWSFACLSKTGKCVVLDNIWQLKLINPSQHRAVRVSSGRKEVAWHHYESLTWLSEDRMNNSDNVEE